MGATEKPTYPSVLSGFYEFLYFLIPWIVTVATIKVWIAKSGPGDVADRSPATGGLRGDFHLATGHPDQPPDLQSSAMMACALAVPQLAQVRTLSTL